MQTIHKNPSCEAAKHPKAHLQPIEEIHYICEKTSTDMKQNEFQMTTIFQSQDLGKIYMAHNQLQNAGIESCVKNEFRPYNVGYIELQVDQKDVHGALEVLRDLYPEEFDRKIVCPHCGSEQVRISSAARNRLWRKVQVFIQQLKYQLQRELPEGTYLCENCHREFLYRKNDRKK